MTNNYSSVNDFDHKDQFHKVIEELGEITKSKTKENHLEECWDVVFATIGYMHKANHSDEEIGESFLKTLDKIRKKSRKAAAKK